MPRTYVDNAYNRRVGRVGMPHGSMVMSSKSFGGGNVSYENSSISSASGTRTYVDNAQNRSLGRVGLPHGSAVHSRSVAGNTSTSSSSSRCYVDNSMNRSLGRVGLEVGTAVHSASGFSTSRSMQASSSNSTETRVYVDNDYNMRLGRVGLPIGSSVQSRSSSVGGAGSGGSARRYVDNPTNRRLGRVGKIVGTAPVSSRADHTMTDSVGANIDAVFRPLARIDAEDDNLGEILQQITRLREELRGNVDVDPERENRCEAAIGIVHRHEAALTSYRAGLRTPEWVRGGELIDFSDIALGEKIGGGGFGDVLVGIWKQTHQVAVKKLRVQRVSPARKQQFQDEVKVFSSLSHPAIIKFFGVCETPPNLAMVMEFMAAGSLYDVLHVEVRPLSTLQKTQMVTDCISAIKYLHNLNIIHRDIKSMNIMVCEDYSHCKLGDFGLALKEESRSSASVADHAAVGTLCYSPPEVVEGRRRLTVEEFKAVDIYSMTVVTMELLTGQMPYSGMNQHQVRRAILAGEKPSFASLNLGTEVTTLLSNGMAKEPGRRPSAGVFAILWDRFSLLQGLSQLTVNPDASSRSTAGLGTQQTRHTLEQIPELNSNSLNSASTANSGSIRSTSSSWINCPVCKMSKRDRVFQCGHSVCNDCLTQLRTCPECRGPVDNAIRLFL